MSYWKHYRDAGGADMLAYAARAWKGAPAHARSAGKKNNRGLPVPGVPKGCMGEFSDRLLLFQPDVRLFCDKGRDCRIRDRFHRRLYIHTDKEASAATRICLHARHKAETTCVHWRVAGASSPGRTCGGGRRGATKRWRPYAAQTLLTEATSDCEAHATTLHHGKPSPPPTCPT